MIERTNEQRSVLGQQRSFIGADVSLQQYRDNVKKGKIEAEAVATLKENLAELEPDISPQPSPAMDSRKVFIVHGHDNALRESAARFLDAAGCEPIILSDTQTEIGLLSRKSKLIMMFVWRSYCLRPMTKGRRRAAPSVREPGDSEQKRTVAENWI